MRFATPWPLEAEAHAANEPTQIRQRPPDDSAVIPPQRRSRETARQRTLICAGAVPGIRRVTGSEPTTDVLPGLHGNRNHQRLCFLLRIPRHRELVDIYSQM